MKPSQHVRPISGSVPPPEPSLPPVTDEGWPSSDEWRAVIRHEWRRREALGPDGYQHAQHIEWLQELERKTGHRSPMLGHAMAMLSAQGGKRSAGSSTRE